MAYLNAGVNVTLIEYEMREGEESREMGEGIFPDQSPIKRKESYLHEGGIKELVKLFCEDKTNLHPDVEVRRSSHQGFHNH